VTGALNQKKREKKGKAGGGGGGSQKKGKNGISSLEIPRSNKMKNLTGKRAGGEGGFNCAKGQPSVKEKMV